MIELLSIARNVAVTDSTVVLSGETGTGKAVLAAYIYANSQRNQKPMVEINCASLPENLLEAELFGYVRGSFTGALNSGKTGLVESANGGTLFLDEINSFPLALQGKLLSMIEDGIVRPIGSLHARKINFRLIAATNRDLGKMVQDGMFRSDLYYRLNVVTLTIPPLRKRKEDIPLLCQYFVNYFQKQYDINKTLSKSVIKVICAHNWPGNVRELRNFVERLMVITPTDVTVIRSIPSNILMDKSAVDSETPSAAKPVLSRESLEEALIQCEGHRERTAQHLGISRRNLQYKLKEFGLINHH
jgi:transcriptional regulator with PAS, ATPase and Fis domain